MLAPTHAALWDDPSNLVFVKEELRLLLHASNVVPERPADPEPVVPHPPLLPLLVQRRLQRLLNNNSWLRTSRKGTPFSPDAAPESPTRTGGDAASNEANVSVDDEETPESFLCLPDEFLVENLRLLLFKIEKHCTESSTYDRCETLGAGSRRDPQGTIG